MYKLTVEKLYSLDSAAQDDPQYVSIGSWVVEDPAEGEFPPFGMNQSGGFQVNLGARGVTLYAPGQWDRVSWTPVETLLKAVS